jgi:uncharacterized protein (TIGR00369 family)
MSDPPTKTVADSSVHLQQLMLPVHANPQGTVHGGVIMQVIDEAGAICAIRHARRPCVTVTVDSVNFHSPVRVGELVACHATVCYVGDTSVEVSVKVRAEDLVSGSVTHTNSARLVYVALDDSGRPIRVPRLRLETDEQRQRWEQARKRHELAQRQRCSSRPPDGLLR